uniref:ECRG4 augurin precursor n=4 Tax=Neoaves TaxID=3078114 RepID=A0A8C0C0D0_9AVES
MRAAEKSYYTDDSWVYYCYCCYLRRAAKHKGDGIIREAFSYLLQAVRFRLTKNFLACLFSGGVGGELISAPVATKPEVSVKEAVAKEFLSSLRRQRRQLWDRSQPDVQQWYQQFLYLGFDEAKFEDDISYWTSLGRARNEYYGGYYQHHYDEDSPIGPRNPHTFRHGAGVNYDDY